jgi:cytochrome c5
MAGKEEMSRYLAFISLLIFLLLGTLGAAALKKDTSTVQKNRPAVTRNNTQEDAGEEVFEANCARCHTPPMSISPRTTGTVIMHMRMRARLSRHDEELLLKYMAP